MQELLEHSDAKTALEIYTHINESRKKENNDRPSDYFTSKLRQYA